LQIRPDRYDNRGIGGAPMPDTALRVVLPNLALAVAYFATRRLGVEIAGDAQSVSGWVIQAGFSAGTDREHSVEWT